VKTFSAQAQLLQLQVVENLLLVHNLDEHTVQAWDLKLGSTDYNDPLLLENLTIPLHKANQGKYLA
jgi:hypothetical protein